MTISHGEKEADIASVKSEFWKNKQRSVYEKNAQNT